MPVRDPTTWSLATWALAFAMASFGGIVNWYARTKKDNAKAFNLIELIGEIVTSAFVGISAFMVLAAYGQPIALCAAAAGIGGNMSTRLLLAAKLRLEAYVKTIK